MSFQSRSCGKCGRTVGLRSHAGDTCPYCGAYWSGEQTRVVGSESRASRSGWGSALGWLFLVVLVAGLSKGC